MTCYEGMVAVIRGVGKAGLAVTLMDGERNYTLMPDMTQKPSGSSQVHVASQNETRDCLSHRDSGDQASDGRYASSYQVAHCRVFPTSPPVVLPEFPPQRAELCRGHCNFEVGGPGSGEAPSVRSRPKSHARPYRSGFTSMVETSVFSPKLSQEPVDSFASSLRKYPAMPLEKSSETIEKLIAYSQTKNCLKYNKCLPTRPDTSVKPKHLDVKTRQRYEESPTRERARRETGAPSRSVSIGRDLRCFRDSKKTAECMESVYYPYSQPMSKNFIVAGSKHSEKYGINSVNTETQAAVQVASKQMATEPDSLKRSLAVTLSPSSSKQYVNVSKRKQSPSPPIHPSTNHPSPELDTIHHDEGSEKSMEIEIKAQSIEKSESNIELQNHKNKDKRRTKSEEKFNTHRLDLENNIIEWLKQEIIERNPDYSRGDVTSILRSELRQMSDKWRLLDDRTKLKIIRKCLKGGLQKSSGCDDSGSDNSKRRRKNNRSKAALFDFSIQCDLLQTTSSKKNDLSEKELKSFLTKELIRYLDKCELEISTDIIEQIRTEIIGMIMNFTNNHGNLISKYLVDDIIAVLYNHTEFTDKQAKLCAESIISHSFAVMNNSTNICQSFIVLNNTVSKNATNNTDLSISAIRDEDINANVEVYKTKLSQEINEWLNKLDTEMFTENSFRQVVINELAEDIIDRQKYIEMNPIAKTSDESEHENLKYQIFKWMNKYVGDENMKAIEHAAELMKKIQRIPVPMTMKPRKSMKFSDRPTTSTPNTTGMRWSQAHDGTTMDQSSISDKTLRKIGKNLPQSFRKYDPSQTQPKKHQGLSSTDSSEQYKTLPPGSPNHSSIRKKINISTPDQARSDKHDYSIIDSPSIIPFRTLPDGSLPQTNGNISHQYPQEYRQSPDNYPEYTLPNSSSILQNRNADRNLPQHYLPNTENNFANAAHYNTFPSNRTPNNRQSSPGIPQRRVSAPNYNSQQTDTRPSTSKRQYINGRQNNGYFQEPAQATESPMIKDLNDDYDKYLQNWVNLIPIQTFNEKEEALAEKARTGIYNGIWLAVNKLKSDPTALNNQFYYEDMLDDDIEQLLMMLPQTPELIRKKQSLKVQLIEKTTNTNEKIKSAAQSLFKQQLFNNVKLKIPRRAVRVDKEEDINKFYEEFEILGLVDDFILYTKYKENDQLKANVYKNRLQRHIAQLVNELKNIHGKELGHINRETYINDIFDALLKVPLPNNETIDNEADEVLIGLEVDRWFKDLPIIENQEYNEQLLRRRLRDNLSKKIHNLEQQGNLSDSKIDYELKQEVSRFLEKVPLKEGESLNINAMVDNLTNRMKNRPRVGGNVKRAVDFTGPVDFDQFRNNVPFSSSLIEQQSPISHQSTQSPDVMRNFQGSRKYSVVPPASLNTEEFHTMLDDGPTTRRRPAPGHEPQQFNYTVPEWNEEVIDPNYRQQTSGYSGPPAFHPRRVSSSLILDAPQFSSTPNQSPQRSRMHESAHQNTRGGPSGQNSQVPRQTYRDQGHERSNKPSKSNVYNSVGKPSNLSFNPPGFTTSQQIIPGMSTSTPRQPAGSRPRAFIGKLDFDDTEEENDNGHERKLRCRCVDKSRCPPWYPYLDPQCYPRYPPIFYF